MWIIILIALGIAIWMSEASSPSRSRDKKASGKKTIDHTNQFLRDAYQQEKMKKLLAELEHSSNSVLSDKSKVRDSSSKLSVDKLSIPESATSEKAKSDQLGTNEDVLDIFSDDTFHRRSAKAKKLLAKLRSEASEVNSSKADITAAQFGVDDSDFQFFDLGLSEFEESVEGKEKQSREFWYKNAIEKQNIKVLIHFTMYENLDSILQNGLVTRSDLNNGTVHGYGNDRLRLDGHHNSISLSISFPNYRMFYKYRQISERKGWVVIEVDPSVLWENVCAFCRHNAADKRISEIPVEKLTIPEAFLELFVEEDEETTRHDLRLLPSDPTDPQAEVLVFGRIQRDKIVSINFEDRFLHRRFSEAHPEIISRVNKHYFNSRSYVR